MKEIFDKQHDTIEFLKEELQEKNLLIRALTIRDANIGSFAYENHNSTSIDTSINDKVSASIHIDQTKDDHVVGPNNDEELYTEENDVIYVKSDVSSNTLTLEDNSSEATMNTASNCDEEGRYKFANTFKWEKHSSGFASKMLNKMGFTEGKGLGKRENGIKEPINIAKLNVDKRNNHERKLIYILSDSMLNRIDAERLSNVNYEVKKYSHGGCKIECMYSHLPEIFQQKPHVIILHVGSNNCVNSTSDKVLKELGKLKIRIQKALPFCKIYYSLPTIRMDNSKANIIIRNLNTKVKKQNYLLVDNSNISEYHIGKKGLHLNAHGIRRVASNIISFIRQL